LRVGIGDKIKIALDEARMLVLGAQILVGFQFRAVFQDGFDQLPKHARWVDGLGLLLLMWTLGLLILPGPYHRIAEDGEDSVRFHRRIGVMISFALAPFAASLGIDFFIAGERLLGGAGGMAAGAGSFALALFLWFGIEEWAKRSRGKRERAMADRQADPAEKISLHEKINQMLTEARVILPGAQALLGFQLAIILTQSFEKLPVDWRLIHGAALICVGVSVAFLMAPAAYHRIVYAGEDSESFHRIGSRFVTASTIPLAFGLALDVAVVSTKILQSYLASALLGAGVLLLLIALWHLLPLLARRHKSALAPNHYRFGSTDGRAPSSR
jgi:hypothetical protein